MTDYLELSLSLDEDETVTLYVHLKDKSLIAFHCVDSDPVRYHGVWNFSHVYVDRRCTSLVPAEDVSYFTILGDLAND
jgi:hypothetical protein